MSAINDANEPGAVYRTPGGALEVDEPTLQAMKQALLAFFRQPSDQLPAEARPVRQRFVLELPDSLCWVSDSYADVGAWKLVEERGQAVLVNYPDIGESVTYHAALAEKSGDWQVVAFEIERDTFPA